MKKIVFLLLLLLAAGSYAQTITLEGIVYDIDTLENHQVGPSTQYSKLLLTAPGQRLDVYFLKTDVTDPYIEIRAAIGRDSIYGGETPSSLAKRKTKAGEFYFAGTNGDFYETTGEATGYPVSGNIIDGEIAKIPGSRHVYVIDSDEKSYIGTTTFSGSVVFGSDTWSINGVNHTRGENELRLYNYLNGKTTRTNQYGTEVEIELTGGDTWGINSVLHAKVTKIEQNKGKMSLSKGNKAVLSGHGTSATKLNTLSVGDDIELRLNMTMAGNITTNFKQMTGGDNYAKIVAGGAVVTSNFWNELHPRTGLGYSITGDTVIFCIVDGRGVSLGCNTRALGDLMKSAGAWTAFNMDGGGSSAMYVAEYGGPVNKVSDGTERAVANSLFIVSSAPEDNSIGIIKPYKPIVSIPVYSSHIPHFYGYNQYGTLLNTDLDGVTLSCPESLGTIQGNKFVASGNITSGNITATYNGSVIATIAVNLIPVSDIKIRLDSAIVDNRSDYPIELLANSAQGEVILSPEGMSWEGTGNSVCEWNYGTVEALENGSTYIYGQNGGVKDSILIKVEIPTAQSIIADSMKLSEWTLSSSTPASLNATLSSEDIPASWDHGVAVNFTQSSVRTPFLKLERQQPLYGLPDTVKFYVNIGNINVSRAAFLLRANNSQTSVTKNFTSLSSPNDFTLTIPLNQVFDTSDRAIFPIWLESMSFYWEQSALTVGQAYKLAIKDIKLGYKDFVITDLPEIKTSDFSVYPNPATNVINLRLGKNYGQTVRTAIYSLSGVLMDSRNHGLYQGETIAIPLKNLRSGIYLLRVFQGNSAKVCKFVVK
jgi:hypothetical protein